MITCRKSGLQGKRAQDIGLQDSVIRLAYEQPSSLRMLLSSEQLMLMTMIKVCLYGKLYRPILSIQRGSPRSLYTQNKFVATQEFVFRSGVTSLKALSADSLCRLNLQGNRSGPSVRHMGPVCDSLVALVAFAFWLQCRPQARTQGPLTARPRS